MQNWIGGNSIKSARFVPPHWNEIPSLMILAQLLDCGLLSKPWFNVSYVFERNKENYTNALRIANTTGDLDSWIMFFLDSVLSGAQNTYKIYHEFNNLQNDCSTKIIELGAKAKNAQRLLEELYSSPYMPITLVADKLGITRTTARSLAEDMINLGILEPRMAKEKSNKLARWQYAVCFKKYIDLFE